jgi:hypothetical protein
VWAATWGEPLNPLAPFIAQTPIAQQVLKFSALLLEAFFWLSLLDRRLFALVIPAALLFHCINSTWLTVTFSGVFIVYPMYVDWQWWWQKLRPRFAPGCIDMPSGWLAALALLVAAVIGLSWNTQLSVRPLLNLGRLLDQRTIWYLVLPIAPVLLLRSIVDLVREAYRTLVGGGSGTVENPDAIA